MNKHPNPEKDAPLWCKIQQGDADESLGYRYIREKILKKNTERAEIDKPSNPHHYCHSRASYLANEMTEAQLCEWFGWDGRLALSDIISESRMPETIKSNADLWAVCIGGAEQVDDYTALIEMPGFEITEVRDNSQYEFTSEQAQGACQSYGVKSDSLSARKR